MGQFPLGRNHRHDMTIYCPANRLDAGDGASTLIYVVVTRGQALSRELYVYQLFQPSHGTCNKYTLLGMDGEAEAQSSEGWGIRSEGAKTLDVSRAARPLALSLYPGC